jgi:deazaflavin-dependent oxidoreductase (nitroreductase family)
LARPAAWTQVAPRAARRWPAARPDRYREVVSSQVHYQRPGWFTRNVFNRVVAGLTRLGVSVLGSRVLEVRGRSSGQWRRNPVNLLTLEGTRYLVAPRGHTQWVRNLRVSHEGRLLLGRRREPFSATEVADDDKPPILRAYLRRWKAEVGVFFGGVGPDSSDEELRRIAPDHPIFRLGPARP